MVIDNDQLQEDGILKMYSKLLIKFFTLKCFIQILRSKKLDHRFDMEGNRWYNQVGPTN
jgi:hypothetical protein